MSPPIKPQPMMAVTVTEGRKEDFWKRHKKDAKRRDEAWQAILADRPNLLKDGGYGDFFQPPKKPRFLKGIHPLYVLKGLPHMFRAVYTIVNDDEYRGPIVRFEWFGDHTEYDTLFGYSTS
jgi:hypothetical protein